MYIMMVIMVVLLLLRKRRKAGKTMSVNVFDSRKFLAKAIANGTARSLSALIPRITKSNAMHDNGLIGMRISIPKTTVRVPDLALIVRIQRGWCSDWNSRTAGCRSVGSVLSGRRSGRDGCRSRVGDWCRSRVRDYPCVIVTDARLMPIIIIFITSQQTGMKSTTSRRSRGSAAVGITFGIMTFCGLPFVNGELNFRVGKRDTHPILLNKASHRGSWSDWNAVGGRSVASVFSGSRSGRDRRTHYPCEIVTDTLWRKKKTEQNKNNRVNRGAQFICPFLSFIH
jgi:hypothetical protein